MPGTGSVGEGRARREIGTLFDSELWWRDQYREIENHGYILRPRYHPNWEPSWKRSGKPFFTAEDGHPTLVSAVYLMPPTLTLVPVANCDGRDALEGWETSHAQEGSYGKGIGDYPTTLVPRAQARVPQSLRPFVRGYRIAQYPRPEIDGDAFLAPIS
jgi:hypothetical protein